MRTHHRLSNCIKNFVRTAPLVMVTSIAAIEKPPEKENATQQAPKERAGEVEGLEQKAPHQLKKIAMLGVGGNTASEALSRHLSLGQGVGLTVFHVVAGSAADKAGIEKHDIITAVNDQVVGSQEDLRAVITAKKPGDEILVKLLHKGKHQMKKVILGEYEGRPGRKLKRHAGHARGQKDLLEMFEGMGGGIAEADIVNMEKAMRMRMEKLQKRLQHGAGPPIDLQRMWMKKGFGMLGGSSVSIKDANGSVTMKSVNGKNEIVVTDNEGKVVFEGPYDTDQDKAALPEDIAERVKRLDLDMKGEHGWELKFGD